MAFDALRDPSLLRFAAVGFVFPFSMGLVVSATPLFAADAGVGEGYIGLVLGGKQHPGRAAGAAGSRAHRGLWSFAAIWAWPQ